MLTLQSFFKMFPRVISNPKNCFSQNDGQSYSSSFPHHEQEPKLLKLLHLGQKFSTHPERENHLFPVKNHVLEKLILIPDSRL